MAEEAQIVKTSKDGHPFHIVNPSIWPLLSSFAGGLLAVGAVHYFSTEQLWLVILGVLSIVICMIGWWRDVIREAVVEKVHTPVVEIGMRYGMLLFIMSEVMFFVAFFWAFFNASLFPTEAIGGIWPPAHIEMFDPFDLPFMMTLILLLSGCTVTWAHAAILENNQKDFATGLGLTVLLGAVFTGFQIYEYTKASFGFTDTVFASNFYMATGFHGFHVFVGTVFLAVCWWRARKNHFTPEKHFGFEAAAWYWHFVDVVWLFLFVAVYWLGA